MDVTRCQHEFAEWWVDSTRHSNQEGAELNQISDQLTWAFQSYAVYVH